jgi:hypothetical protein
MIDGASAILSVGGGKAFSVHSSKMSKLSMMTPVTHLSVASSKLKSDFTSTCHSSPKSKARSIKSERKMYQTSYQKSE